MREKSPYWGKPKNAPVHPYTAYEGTPLWKALKKALISLDRNQDISLTEWHQYVVGYLCQELNKQQVVGSKEQA
jgi:hypothetical protein